MSATASKGKSKQVCVVLPSELNNRLEEVTENHPYDVPKSEVVRAALREHLEEQ